jgi:hypothetical protein
LLARMLARRKSKGPASLQALDLMVRPERFERQTPWFVVRAFSRN